MRSVAWRPPCRPWLSPAGDTVIRPAGSVRCPLPTDQAWASRMAETSNSSVTFSLTRTPPASSAAFQLTPKSLRLIVVAPSNPIRVLPYGSTAVPVYSKSTLTAFVTALIVRSPVTRKLVSSSCFHLGRPEGDLGVGLHVEEVVAAQVAVAVGVAGVDARGLDGERQAGVRQVVGVERAGAGEVVERPADLGDHGVTGDEADPAVGRVDAVRARSPTFRRALRWSILWSCPSMGLVDVSTNIVDSSTNCN